MRIINLVPEQNKLLCTIVPCTLHGKYWAGVAQNSHDNF
jgi:hypothetical protein